MTTPSVSESKAALRRSMRTRLAQISPEHRAQWSDRIMRAVLDCPEFTAARCVMLYAPLPGEPDNAPLWNACQQGKQRIAVPRVDWQTGHMAPALVHSPRDLVTGAHGVLEPDHDSPTIPHAQIDLVIVPGLAFDRAGRRLGRGKGFYDRFLRLWRPATPAPPTPPCHDRAQLGRATHCYALGVAFHVQLVDEVPVDAHDEVLDAVATDAQFIPCTRN